LASDKDILGQADALLRRHAISAPATGSDTGGVPVLTELVGVHKEDVDPDEELAMQVFAKVMADIEDRLVLDLERRLMRHLAPTVHAAASSAVGDLHQELANAIREAVAAALKARTVK
jgi:hypothetical protein